MSESTVLRQVHIGLVEAGSRVFRNNVGVLQDRFGQYVSYGLCRGSSDLIGWTPIIVTPEMVGKKVAVFTACEVKDKKGRATMEQENFIAVVGAAGGIAFIVRSDADAITRLAEAKAKWSI